jgi:hypothetical protein
MSDALRSEPRMPPEPYRGLTLADLILMMASGWALPFAVRDAQGSGWPLALACLVAAVVALFWTWYCKRLEWFVLSRYNARYAPLPEGEIPMPVVAGVYLTILGATLFVQYGLYRGVLGVLRA